MVLAIPWDKHMGDIRSLQFASLLVLLVAFAAFALSAIAFLLMYYQIYSNAQAMVWAAFALSAALLALLAAFFTAFRRYVSVYLEDSGKKIPVFTIHEDDVRKKPGARAQKHYRRARK